MRSLAFGENTMTLKDSAHLRVVVDDTDAKVAVFKGDAEITSPSGNVEISKNHTADVELLFQDKCIVDKGVDPAPFDDWDKEQAQYHERYQNTSTMASSQYGYGASDLNYYGSYFD